MRLIAVALLVALFVFAVPVVATAVSTYTLATPAPGSVTPASKPLISVRVSDPAGIWMSGAQIKVDGVSRTPRLTWGPGNSYLQLSYQQTTALKNGTHTVYASVFTGAGRTSYTWTFSVNSAPSIGPLTPADGSTVNSQLPVISAGVVPNGLPVAWYDMTVDGASVTPVYDSALRTISYTPATPLANDAEHAVTLRVTDTGGASSEVAWRFGVQIYADMEDTAGCTDCHIGYPSVHPMTNCDGCHELDGPFPPYWSMDPQYAEVHSTDFITDVNCTYCHSTVYPNVPGHYASTASIHYSGTDMSGCACHVRNLTIEHNRYTTPEGEPITCVTCHLSDDPVVQAAMAEGRRTCADCHPSALSGSHDALHTLDRTDTCIDCHEGDSLTQVHLGSGLTCNTCHASTDPDVLAALGNDLRACASCHTAQGVDYHTNMSVHFAPNSYEACGSCHHAWGSNPLQGPDVTRHEAGCTTCHNDQTDLNGLTTACSSCHIENGVDFHPSLAQDHTPLDQASTDCARCHGSTDVRVVHTTWGCETCHSGGCSDCHSIHNPNGGALERATSCHVCHETAGTDYHLDFGVDHTFAGLDVGCEGGDCHSASLVDSHAQLVGPDGRYSQYSDTCALCHLNLDPLRIPAGATADCSTCHEAHGDLDVLHTATLGSGGIHLFDNHDGWMGSTGAWMDCADCHSASLGDIHAARCATCHPTPRDAFEDWGGSCTQGGCHTSYHTSGFDHDAVDDGNCSACHDEAMFRLYDDPCVDCHPRPDASDVTPPVTTSNAQASYIGTARISFHQTDGGMVGIGTTLHRLDGGAITTGDYLDVASPGAHTVEFWSVDQNGNAEVAHHTVAFTVVADTTAPVTSVNAQAEYFGPTTLRLTVVESSFLGVKGTYYQLNGGAVQSGTTISIPQPAGSPVAYTLTYWSEDWSGNVEIAHTFSFTVNRDTTPPVSTLGVLPYYRSTYVSIPFSATDNGIGTVYRYYRLDGGSTYSMPSYQGSINRTLTLGTHTIEYWAVDAVGNVETHRFASFSMDMLAPTVSSDAAESYPETGAQITITGADETGGSGLSRIAYRVDGGSEQAAASPSLVEVLTEGTHSIEYWSVDNAGNTSPHVIKVFVVGTATSGQTGTIRLVWGDADVSGYTPVDGSWASWTIRSGGPTGPVVTTGSSSAPGWDGVDDVVVPVSATPYYVHIDWWDEDWWMEGPTIHPTVYVAVPGGVTRLSY